MTLPTGLATLDKRRFQGAGNTEKANVVTHGRAAPWEWWEAKMMDRPQTTRRTARRGFTLVEILVVILLLVALAGMVVPAIRSDTPQQKLERSADRFSSLLGMSRAEAMLEGRPYRITWPSGRDSADGTVGSFQPLIEHEADPLGSPGQYEQIAASWARQPVLEPDVQVRLVQPGDLNLAALSATQGTFALPSEPSLVDVQLRPDGTADPAVFVVSITPGDDAQEELQVWVVLDGITGLSKVRAPPTPAQFETILAQQSDLPDLQFEEQVVEVPEQAVPDEQTLAGLLNGSTGGGDLLPGNSLQQILTALQPALDSARNGTGMFSPGAALPGATTPGTGAPGEAAAGTANPNRRPGNDRGNANNPNNPSTDDENTGQPNRRGGNRNGGSRSGARGGGSR